MTNTLYLPELREMLAENNVAEMHAILGGPAHPARTARKFMEGLTAAESAGILKHADPATRGQIFSYFDRDKQVEIIRERRSGRKSGNSIAELPADDRVDILKAVPADRRRRAVAVRAAARSPRHPPPPLVFRRNGGGNDDDHAIRQAA